MSILNDIETVKKIDSSNVLSSINTLPEQCLHAYEESSQVQIPDHYNEYSSVLFSGMGGSGLAGRIIESIYSQELKVPLIRLNDYKLPKFVNENTLIFCSSYSGTTEETISSAQEAISKNAKWFAIASGGTLLDLAQIQNAPYFKINPTFNPSSQPRMAVGYSLISHLVLASKIGLLKFTENELSMAKGVMESVISKCQIENSDINNPAKELAYKLHDRVIIFVSAQHLSGPVHTINNQFNENAKNFTIDQVIPELNHHLMEGLKYPGNNDNNLVFLFIDSNLYSDRIKQRFEITKEVVEKQNIPFYTIRLESEEKLSQAFELIQFGSYINFYLSMLYNQNPAPIPWVDYFKTRLGQPLGK